MLEFAPIRWYSMPHHITRLTAFTIQLTESIAGKRLFSLLHSAGKRVNDVVKLHIITDGQVLAGQK